MRSRWIAVVVVGILFCVGQQAGALPSLPVTTGLIYQLDASDAASIAYDVSGNITSWASSQGANPVTMVPVPVTSTITPPTYLASGSPSGLPAVKFVATTGPNACQKLVSGSVNAVPRSVFIVENTDSPPGNGVGGIWGRRDADQGVRFWSDNTAPALWGEPLQPANTHQLVNAVIRSGDNRYVDFGINTNGDNGQPMWTDNYRWTDTTLFDSRQTWTNMNWGVVQGDRYATALGGASNWTQGTALGNYYEGPNRSWSGQLSEVLVYDAWLSETDRQAVESYLKAKWLVSSAPASFTATPAGPFDFGNVGVSTLSAVQTVTLTNGGDLSGDITGASVTGGFVFTVPEPGTPTYSVLGHGTAVYGIQLPAQTLPGSYSGVATFTTSAGGPFTYNLTAVTAVPEPATLSLLALAGLAALRRKR